SQALLKPGFFAKATIATEKRDSILVAPADAVSFAYGVYKVFAIKDDEISMQDVRVGDHIGDEVELIEGAKEHQKIAVSNLARLKDGTKISVGEGKGGGKRKAGGDAKNEGDAKSGGDAKGSDAKAGKSDGA